MTRDRHERVGTHLEHVWFVIAAQPRSAQLAFDDTHCFRFEADRHGSFLPAARQWSMTVPQVLVGAYYSRSAIQAICFEHRC